MGYGTLAGLLRNRGHLTLPSGQLNGAPGAVLDNTGLLDLNNDANQPSAMHALGGTPVAALYNRGVIRKTAGNATTTVDWALANQGLIIKTLPLPSNLVFTGPSIDSGVGSSGSAGGSESEFYGSGNDAEPGLTHCDCGDPVNITSGNLYEELTDLQVPGRGESLAATRSYNAQAAINESAGLTSAPPNAHLAPGWTHAYAAFLDLTASGYATVHQANGATSTFTSSGSTFTAANRVKAKLATGANSTYVLTYSDQTKQVFDSAGKLIRLVNRNGYPTTLAYDANGRLDHVSDEAGRHLSYTYDASNRIATITDPLGRRVSYGYDSHGDLTDVTDAAGKASHYAYDAQHRMISVRDPLGHSTTSAYDPEGRVTSQTDPRGGTLTFAYTATSTTITDPRGYRTRYELTGGLVSKIVRAVSTAQQATTTFVHDDSGNVTRRTDPNGQLTQLDYDAAGNVTQITDPLNRVTTMTYSAANDLLTSTNPAGTATTYTYDATGNPTSIATPLTGTSSTATTTFAYDPAKPGDLVTRTDPNGHAWHYTYNSDGDRVGATDPEGDQTTTAYNQDGWPTSVVSPRGNAPGANAADYTTTTAYNDRGQPTSVTDPVGASTTTAYDDNGNVTSITQPGNKTTTTAYDALDRPTAVTRPDGSVLHFAYDATGNRTSVKDGLDHETTYTYDPLGRQSSQTDADNRVTSYAYDASGRQTQISDATARTTTLGYDAASQLQSIDYSDSQTADVDYDYDLLGRRTRMVDGSGTSSYAYDSLGRLTSKTDGSAHTLGYSYDLAGHLTKTTYPAGLVAATAPGQTISDPSVTSSHDNAGRVSAVTDWLGHRTEFDYDADGNPTAQRYPNQTSAAITYDHADRQTRRTDSGPGSTTILDLTATRNANGQLATQTRDPSPPPATQTLTYDALDQLTQATTGSGPSAETYSYAHDVGDRLTRIASPTADTTLVYDAANQLTQTKDTTTGTTTQTFTYDLLGDRTSQDPAGPTTATTYSYDQANRLTGEHNPASSPDITYAYDGDGLRADVLWDTVGGLPVIVADSAGLYVSGPDGLPLTQLTFSGQQRYYHHDQLGSTRAITDAAGAVTARYSFDPYGNPTTDSSGADSRFGYAGQYTDHATALIYMRARWYDPATGQFLTRDPLEAITGSAYGYANADPINLVDPSGLTPWWMRASNAAAGELNVLTAGLSNRIAGAAFGFDASCANFGEGYGTGEGAAALALIATGVVGGARAIGARAAKGGGRLPWAGHRPYVAEPRASALPKRPAEARVGLPARATRHAQGQVPAVERIRRERQAGP